MKNTNKNAMPGFLAEGAQDYVNQGSCGAEAQYALSKTGTLLIFGEGEISPNSFSGEYSNDKVRSVVIFKGITSIGDNAFAGCGNLRHLRLQNLPKISHVGKDAFKGCTKLKNGVFHDRFPWTEIRKALESDIGYNYKEALSRAMQR